MISIKTKPISDEEMIRNYLSSHPTHCFDAIYKRYVGKVYRRCLSMVKDPLKAEDFTHDIFLKVFNKLGNFQQRSSFSTWLYSIAYNYCSDQLRLGRRMQMIEIEEGFDYAISEAAEEKLHEETILLVSRAMERLSANEKALLHFKYEEGMSIAEIAQICSLNQSTVKMRLKRSRDKVQRLCILWHVN